MGKRVDAPLEVSIGDSGSDGEGCCGGEGKAGAAPLLRRLKLPESATEEREKGEGIAGCEENGNPNNGRARPGEIPVTPRSGNEVLKILGPRSAGGGAGRTRTTGGETGTGGVVSPKGGGGYGGATPRGRAEAEVDEGWSVRRVGEGHAQGGREREERRSNGARGAEEQLEVILRACRGRGDELMERVGEAVMTVQAEMWRLKDSEKRSRRRARGAREREEMLMGLLDDTTSEVCRHHVLPTSLQSAIRSSASLSFIR